MYTYIYLFTFTRMHVTINHYMHLYIYVCVHIQICVCGCIHVCTFRYTCLHIRGLHMALPSDMRIMRACYVCTYGLYMRTLMPHTRASVNRHTSTRRQSKKLQLPQINMEAHRSPYIEDSSFIKVAPLHFQVNLQECTYLVYEALSRI